MAVITKGASGLVLTTAANWVGGVAPGAADVARWTSVAAGGAVNSSSGNHTGSRTILGLQIDDAAGDVNYTSGTLTLTQTDAFVNGTSNSRRFTCAGGTIALGSANRTLKLFSSGTIPLLITGNHLTGSGIITLQNAAAGTDPLQAMLGINHPTITFNVFTGTIVLQDGTGLGFGLGTYLTTANVTIDGANCQVRFFEAASGTLGASGKTLTINNDVTIGNSNFSGTIAFAVVLGSTTRTLTVAGNTTMSGTVTGTAGVTVAGSSATSFLLLTGSSSGLTGAVTVNSGRLVVTGSARMLPSAISVAADSEFTYSTFTDSFDFPVAPTGLGLIGIGGDVPAGTGCTFPVGYLSGFGGVLGLLAFPQATQKHAKARIYEVPGGLRFIAYGANTTPLIVCEATYLGSGQTSTAGIIIDSSTSTVPAGLTSGTYSIIQNGASGALVMSGAVQRTNTSGITSARMNLTLGGTNTGDNTLSGAISEVGTNGAILGITKVDAGRWVLSGNSTHTGVHIISAGTLAANSATALGSATSTGGVSITGTGVLELGDGVTLNKSVTDFSLGNATNPVQTAGTSTLQSKQVTLSVTPTFTVPSGRKLTIAPQGAGVIGGSGTGITKAGDGELELTATANTFTGAVTVSAGTLTVGSVANANAPAAWGQANGAVLVSGTLKYNGATGSSSRAVQMTGSAPTLNASGSGALTLSNVTQDTTAKTMTLRGTSTDANTISSAIANNTGAISVAKEDAGRWVLSGALSYTGTTAINAGTLRVEAGANNNYLLSGAVTIGASGTVELVTDGNPAIGPGNGEVLGNGAMVVNGGTIKTRGGTTQKGQVRYGGNLTFGAGSSLYIGAAA